MENRILIVGFFARDKNFFNGQVVKTRLLSDYIKETYGKESIQEIDTYGWKRKPFSFFIRVIKSYFKVDKVIVLPAHNGVKVFIPLLVILNLFKKNTIIYSVIGGWLPSMLNQNKILKYFMKKLTVILVETSTMKRELKKIGITNTEIMLNGKDLRKLAEKEIKKDFNEPLKICIFSRIIAQKGIEEAIKAVEEVNTYFGDEIYHLDLFGEIDKDYEKIFNDITAHLPKYISYRGVVEPTQSVDVLKNYYFLLFPTKFYTEGIPGTIIDAYFSGVPVIASNWQSSIDIVIPNKTGIIYDFDNYKELVGSLIYAYKNKEVIIDMRAKCLEFSEKYTTEKAFKVIDKFILE